MFVELFISASVLIFTYIIYLIFNAQSTHHLSRVQKALQKIWSQVQFSEETIYLCVGSIMRTNRDGEAPEPSIRVSFPRM